MIGIEERSIIVFQDIGCVLGQVAGLIQAESDKPEDNQKQESQAQAELLFDGHIASRRKTNSINIIL
jgi:hypothetical protein